MSKLIAILATLSLLFSLAGNTVAKSAAVVAASAPAKNEKPQYETRAYIRKQCFMSRTSDKPKAEFLPVLAAIFVPLLLEKALGGIGGALKKAGSEETLRDSGRLPTYLYRLTRKEKVVESGKIKEPAKNILDLNPDFGCVLVVRGTFNSPDDLPPKQTQYGTAVSTDNSENGRTERLTRLVANGIPVSKVAALYEAEINIAKDKTALLYESRFLEVNEFQGSRSHDSRAMVTSIAISGAGAKEGEPLLSLVLVNLGDVPKNTVLGPDKLRGRRTSWVGGLGISDASLKALETINFPPEPESGDDRKYLEIMPITVEAVFAETDEGNKALKFIGEVLESTKGDVSKALSAEILKDRGKQASEAADALEKIRQEEEAAYGEYLKAKAEYNKLGLPTPLPDNFTLTDAQKITKFDRDMKLRLWCLKFRALQTLGSAPVIRDPDCK